MFWIGFRQSELGSIEPEQGVEIFRTMTDFKMDAFLHDHGRISCNPDDIARAHLTTFVSKKLLETGNNCKIIVTVVDDYGVTVTPEISGVGYNTIKDGLWFQSDGNLVLYEDNGEAPWASGKWGNLVT